MGLGHSMQQEQMREHLAGLADKYRCVVAGTGFYWGCEWVGGVVGMVAMVAGIERRAGQTMWKPLRCASLQLGVGHSMQQEQTREHLAGLADKYRSALTHDLLCLWQHIHKHVLMARDSRCWNCVDTARASTK